MRRRGAVLLGLGLAACAGAPRVAPAPAPAPAPAEAPAPLGVLVAATAREAMGRPYRYGGTGAEGDGFDCSGLIQSSYARHGVALPRTSREQARAGTSVAKRLDALRAGDLLTFSSQPHGDTVAHVGLYVGDGRFIHSSSSRGVMESGLSERDPSGAWWWPRWVGVRRVVP
ncbi:MAG: C40 family peptidase [Gemmatimonadales bacterium]|jgi:cell wall-associated NlpC family hydrolase|nr:C40 family peptidase [Gemmatimonadales bacterium]